MRRILALMALLAGAWLRAQDPFTVETDLQRGPPAVLRVTFRVPAEHYLYAHMIQVEPMQPSGVTLTALSTPPATVRYDTTFEKELSTYDKDITFTYRVDGLADGGLAVAVSYQGCTESMCFLPQRLEMVPGVASTPAVAAAAAAPPTAAAAGSWWGLAERFEVVATGSGYMDSDAFLEFLRSGDTGAAHEENLLEAVFRRHGLLVALLLVLPLGLLLNLTPCVLPMIPVNLAIIGAGQGQGSRSTGLLRGAIYGAGMALVYGLLGVAVVLTGSRFGALNASPWFNAAIAVVFVILGLAMFDVLVLDLSRFQRAGPTAEGSSRSPMLAAFVLGGTAALLAGACVAPVLIWVLVLATNLYANGNPAGLLLPLALGVGMALPWPIVGAGLSVLPRPGAWMNRIKTVFGVMILLFAVYYASLSVRLFMAQQVGTQHSADVDGWNTSLTAGLQEAHDSGRGVVIDFWALTCKSCMKMKRTTFKDPAVVAALEPYVRIAVQTDDMKDPVVRGSLDYYKVMGLPTYVVLRPRSE